MKKIKVYLQYPWKFPDSPYYKYLLQEHPKEIEYLNVEKQKGVITNKKFFWFSNFLKRNIRRTFNLVKFSIPNAHLSPKGDYDLIHCAHCLNKDKTKPWVCDIESEWQLYVGNKNKFVKKKVERILKRDNCKKILPWAQFTANEIIKEYPSIKDKIEVVYPAIPVVKNLNRKKEKEIILLFIGRYFYWKGGLYALEVMDRLTKKYKTVKAICVSEVPEEVKEKYSSNKKIKIYGLMSQEKVFEIYNQSNIFIYPGFSDSFGFGFLEAMNFGLPIITIDNGGCRREILEDKKTGFISVLNKELNENLIKKIDNEIINSLVKNTSKLIEDNKLRNKMSKECIKVIKEGKFSIKERNKKMKKIYEETLK